LDEDAAYPPDPPLDALFVVVAEMHRAGLFDSSNLASMKRRLELSGHSDLAERLDGIPLANAIDTPENNREALRVVDCDGGNADD
jgi:hypothetical protein